MSLLAASDTMPDPRPQPLLAQVWRQGTCLPGFVFPERACQSTAHLGEGVVSHLHSIRNKQQGPRPGSQERRGVFVSRFKSHQNGVSDQEKEWKGGGPLPFVFNSQRLPVLPDDLARMTTSLLSPLAQENTVQGEARGSHALPAFSAEGAPARRSPRLGRARLP